MQLFQRSVPVLRCPKNSCLLRAALAPNYLARHAFLNTDAKDTVVGRCESKISAVLKPTRLVVHGMHDDPNGSHIVVEVVSSLFEGKNAVMRQRMVYKALWDEMSAGGQLHAVDSIVAKTPEEDKAK